MNPTMALPFPGVRWPSKAVEIQQNRRPWKAIVRYVAAPKLRNGRSQTMLSLILLVITFAATNTCADEPRQLSIISQQTILAKDDAQLHFPFLHEAEDGAWYMTYREGRHGFKEETVHCIMSTDRGEVVESMVWLAGGTEVAFVSHSAEGRKSDQSPVSVPRG